MVASTSPRRSCNQTYHGGVRCPPPAPLPRDSMRCCSPAPPVSSGWRSVSHPQPPGAAHLQPQVHAPGHPPPSTRQPFGTAQVGLLLGQHAQKLGCASNLADQLLVHLLYPAAARYLARTLKRTQATVPSRYCTIAVRCKLYKHHPTSGLMRLHHGLEVPSRCQGNVCRKAMVL